MQTTWPLGYVLTTSLCRPLGHLVMFYPPLYADHLVVQTTSLCRPLGHLIILESIALSRYPSNACTPPQISQGFIYRGDDGEASPQTLQLPPKHSSFPPNTPAPPPPPPKHSSSPPPPKKNFSVIMNNHIPPPLSSYNISSSISSLKVVVYPSYNDIHDIFLSEISSQRSRH